MIRAVCLALGFATLAIVWLGPLAELAPRRFSAHMTMHMGVVAIAAPLVAFGIAGGRLDPARKAPALFSAIPASILELLIVWTWHTPALHHAARGSLAGLTIEQSTFFASGFLLWMSALGGDDDRGHRAAAGVVALLLTSMHMTLLGALIALSPRPLYIHAPALPVVDAPLQEQHVGGVIMLLVGGVSYLGGGLLLMARLMRTPSVVRGRCS